MANEKTIFDNIPLSGGNTYTMEKNLKAQIDIDLSTITQNVKNSLSKFSASSSMHTYNEWFLLNLMADYFVSIFPFKFESATLNRACYAAMRVAQLYGGSGIYKLGINLMPCYIVKSEVDIFGNFTRLEVSSAYNVLSLQSITPKIKTPTIIIEGAELQNFAYLLPNGFGFGGIVKWMPFIKQLNSLLKMGYSHSYSFIKTILYKVKDTSAITQELDLYFNAENPFLLNVNDEDNLIGNKFQEFNFANNDKSSFMNYVDWFLNTHYNLLGRRFNVDTKNERNIAAEVNASQDNFDILQNEQVIYTIDFLNKVREMTGLEWDRNNQNDEMEQDNEI